MSNQILKLFPVSHDNTCISQRSGFSGRCRLMIGNLTAILVAYMRFLACMKGTKALLHTYEILFEAKISCLTREIKTVRFDSLIRL